MAYIRRRKLPSGKIRWQVIWDSNDVASSSRSDVSGVERLRDSEMFDTQREAKEKLAAILGSKPKRSAAFDTLTEHFLSHYEKIVENGERERSTLRQLRQHINLHILIDREFSSLKCGQIDTPAVQLFLDRLIERVSPKMATKVRGTLSRLFAHGARRGFVAGNPVSSSKLERRTRPDAGEPEHFILPPKADLRTLLATARTCDNTGRAEAVVRSLMFAGLRMSEFRGLWLTNVSIAEPAPNVKIVQRADRDDEIGPVKSKLSRRTIEIGDETAKALSRWTKARPDHSKLLFPNEEGNVWSYANFWHRFWVPLLNAAGLVTDEPASKTVRDWSRAQATFRQPRFSPHMLRHVYASLQIERGVSPKRLQRLMGHSTLKLTLDTYGHLWPDESADRERARNVENAL
jgi:site-specific recombinase XerD